MPAEIHAKTVLNKKKKRDHWFLDDYTFNPYSGCSFNCKFCYIRGSKYGTNMERSLSVKINAVDLLDKELSRKAKKGEYGLIAVSSATDPYLQFEEHYKLTRSALEVILKHRFPVHIITRSDLVIRDFDLLHQIDREARLPADLPQLGRGVVMSFSFSTLDDQVRARFEPGSTPIGQRLKALIASIEAGFYSGVSLMPLFPFISDTPDQLRLFYKRFRELGAHYLFPAGMTLFGHDRANSRMQVFEMIDQYYPEFSEDYRNLFGHQDYLSYAYQRSFKIQTDQLAAEFSLPPVIHCPGT